MGAGDEASAPQGGGVPGPLSWNKLAEVLKCLQAYEQLPPSLTDEDVREASAAGAYRWSALMAERRLAHLAMGAMAAAIMSAASEAAEGACENDVVARRLHVWSGHDSTLFGLLAAFELDAPSAWPPCAPRPPLAPSTTPRTLAPSPGPPSPAPSPMHAPGMLSSRAAPCGGHRRSAAARRVARGVRGQQCAAARLLPPSLLAQRRAATLRHARPERARDGGRARGGRRGGGGLGCRVTVSFQSFCDE